MNSAITFWLILLVGWIINLVTMTVDIISTETISAFNLLQVVGVFTGPFGSIIGYISIFV